jgi:hypothetical protein
MQNIGLSKLANILFAKELQRRLDMEAIPAVSISLHPANSRTGKHIYFETEIRHNKFEPH